MGGIRPLAETGPIPCRGTGKYTADSTVPPTGNPNFCFYLTDCGLVGIFRCCVIFLEVNFLGVSVGRGILLQLWPVSPNYAIYPFECGGMKGQKSPRVNIETSMFWSGTEYCRLYTVLHGHRSISLSIPLSPLSPLEGHQQRVQTQAILGFALASKRMQAEAKRGG